MDGILRILAGTASMPAGFMAGAIHRYALGPAAVLDVKVNHMPDVMDRQALVHRLRRVALDGNVSAVMLRLQGPPGGYAACQDLRTSIAAVRRSGKPVHAYVESPGNALMWVASACDRIVVVPSGEIGLVGLGVEMTFFGSALERLGLTPDFEAAGAYKSFGEPWTRSFPSAANQEAMGQLIEDLHERIVADIAEGRGLEVAAVRAAIERAPLSAEEALEAGLVDALQYEDQLEDWVEEQHGEKSKRVEFETWAARDAWLESIDGWGEGAKLIAVLHFDGPIVMDSQGGGRKSIAARKVVPILRKLRENERVAAVVLHVNSPGGHAMAADMMWREVEAMKADKPVIACYEDVAASGGVYLAAPAAEILARPASLTGSIGVFGGKLVAGEGMRRLGLHIHEVAEAPNANMFSPHKRFSDGQRERFRSMLQRFYDGFVERVAKGRDKPVEDIEPHCRGRVWTGQAAQERGLVDRHGDLHDAVERARVLAGLQLGSFRRVDMSCEPKTYLQKKVQEAMRELNPAAAAMNALVPPGILSTVRLAVEHPAEPLAVMPWEIRLR